MKHRYLFVLSIRSKVYKNENYILNINVEQDHELCENDVNKITKKHTTPKQEANVLNVIKYPGVR